MSTRPTRTLVIANQLTAAIEKGEYAADSQLPAERVLAKTLGVSRVTLRRALQYLESQGYIERRGNAGTFVTSAHQRSQRIQASPPANLFVPPESPVIPTVANPFGPVRWLVPQTKFSFDAERGPSRHMRFLAPTEIVPANPYIAKELNLPPGAMVLRRLRLIENSLGIGPNEIADGYYPAQPFADLSQLENDGISIERWLADNYGRHPKHVIEVTVLRQPEWIEASLLRISSSAPVFEIERKVLDQDGRPLEVARLVRAAKDYFIRYEYDVESEDESTSQRS